MRILGVLALCVLVGGCGLAARKEREQQMMAAKAAMDRRNLPIRQPREPEPSTINEKTIADFTRVTEVVTALFAFFSISVFLAHAFDAYRSRGPAAGAI